MGKKKETIKKETLAKAWHLMTQARAMSTLYEDKREVTGKYVHATSMGHEAVQLALGLQLNPQDYVSPYYRDDSILLGVGMKPYDLMLQLLGKKDDPFSGGRLYYSHPSLKDDDKPKMPYQSSATGMQAIPATGLAMGVQYREKENIGYTPKDDRSVVVCSIGDAAMTEGEISEALHMAALKQLPILYFVQDNEWDISAHSSEIRLQNSAEYAKGFKGIEIVEVDGANFFESYSALENILTTIRKERRPFLIRASVPLLGHHTSGVRKETYRDDLDEAMTLDPYPRYRGQLLENGFTEKELNQIESDSKALVLADFERAQLAADPTPEDLFTYDYAPTPITEEKGVRAPEGKDKTVMVDSALFAIREIMAKHPESLLYGQDVGARIGGVFREAATLAQQFGDDRVFNTPIQEAFIVGSTVGMSAVGLKPIVEVQFADYIWPGLNQLFTEVGRSYYLSNGKWPVSMILRVPIGAYGSGGPYHSSSVESIVTNIRGVKVAYPSTGADLKGLMKAAYYDPNPVVMLEHKGLYWSKIKGTEGAMTVEPDEEYIIPFGKARTVLEAPKQDNSVAIITYGMGVYWSLAAEKQFKGQVEIIDLRTLNPLDEEAMYAAAKKHNKILVVTEESVECSFALGLVARIQKNCFKDLDAPVEIIGSVDTPAIPLNSILEETLLPNGDKVAEALSNLLKF